MSLAPWTFHSRRVFHLTEELQALLAATSLRGMKWSDVSWLFPSFVVILEQPIVGDSGKADCIVVNQALYRNDRTQYVITSGELRLGDEKVLYMRLLPRELCNIGKLSTTLKKQIESAIAAKQWRRVCNLIDVTPESGQPISGLTFALDMNRVADELVTKSIKGLVLESGMPIDNRSTFRTSSLTEWNEAARIVVGMCLYLSTLPLKSPHRSNWTPARQQSNKPDSLAVTSEAEVCTVSSVHTLTREEREVLGLEGAERQRAHYEVKTHFRRGHWRRPPGMGDDPNALKIVWVKPTLVRRDRLPENALPSGAEAQLS